MKDQYYISLLIPGMACQGDTLETKSLGGSETAGVCVARELAKIGHTVKVFSNCDVPGDYNGVQYYPAAHFQDCLERVPGDVLISQRTPDPFISRSVHKLHLLWCHDLALGRAVNSFRSVCWNVDKFLVVSEWMKNQYIQAMGVPADMVYPTRNGIDLFRFPRVDMVQKNRKRLVYAARPERGLDVMLERIFPALLEKDPEFELALFGYDNPVEHLRAFYEDLAAKSHRFGDKVRFMGHLTKQELYQAYASFGIYTYPTPSPKHADFREVSCISAMEAMASGMPIVTSDMGALSETIPEGAGVLVGGDPMSDEYRDTFVDAVLDFAHNDDSYKAAAAVGMEHAESLSWTDVAEDWSEKIGQWLFERNNDRVRLAHHFYRRNDVFATLEALKGQKSSNANKLRMKVKDEYDFALCGDPDVLKAHYLQGGVGTDERLSANPVAPEDLIQTREPRFMSIRDYLLGQEGLDRVLDYGCGHGWSTSYLGTQIGGHWVGVDLDPGAVKWARAYTDSLKDEISAEFIEGDHTTDTGDELFDAAVISEVLEHCPDPYAVIEAVEKKVKPGGPIVVTVPFGPSEFGTPNWDTFRGHLWEFDIHDLRDVFGKKPDYAASSGPIYPNPMTGDMIGFHFVTYKADHHAVGRVDMKRKLRLQRPRETVSASIIAGPNAEQTLGWCLASIKPFVDEIIIADTGLDDMGRMIAERYGAKVVKGSDPLEAGFETPSNEALDACSMDWVLWIDTDEKLLGGPNLSKYLRFNLWHGLSIMQHHFSVDAGFSPDMPVRLFRRGPCARDGKLQGTVMRHYGMIHEHPELALNEGPGDVLVLPDVQIAHTGYLDEPIRRQRFLRNSPLLAKDREKYPDRLLQKHFIMRDNMLLCSYEASQNGGKITDGMREMAEETVALYREHFLGQAKYANIDSLPYYTQALQILGRGVDVSYMVAASRDGIGDNHNNGTPVTARFETYEEAQIEISNLLKNKFDPLLPEMW